MKLIPLIFILFTFSGIELLAQNNSYTSASDSDIEAIRILDKIRTKYETFRTIEADFKLEISFPGQELETQKGRIQRKGDLVRFSLGQQEGIINTNAAYIISHGNKEVSINNLPEPGETSGFITPQTLFSFYEGDNYVFSLQGQEKIENRLLKFIDMKPLNRDDVEFSKLRVWADTKSNDIVKIKAYVKNGSQYTFNLENVRGNVSFPDTLFDFDKSSFPNYYIEDLRY